jgi:hypothetical protein
MSCSSRIAKYLSDDVRDLPIVDDDYDDDIAELGDFRHRPRAPRSRRGQLLERSRPDIEGDDREPFENRSGDRAAHVSEPDDADNGAASRIRLTRAALAWRYRSHPLKQILLAGTRIPTYLNRGEWPRTPSRHSVRHDALTPGPATCINTAIWEEG